MVQPGTPRTRGKTGRASESQRRELAAQPVPHASERLHISLAQASDREMFALEDVETKTYVSVGEEGEDKRQNDATKVSHRIRNAVLTVRSGTRRTSTYFANHGCIMTV